MSRIHEALKKAEQERAVSQGGQSPSNFAPAISTATPATMIEETAAVPSSAAPFPAGMPSFNSSFSIDALGALSATGLATGPKNHAVF
jgi:hypothetical protein